MFDHLEWWQVLLVLGPVVAIMHGIRWREMVLSSTSYKELTAAQKIYLLLALAPPGIAAQMWLDMSESERSSCLKQGAKLRGTGRNLHAPLMKEFLKLVPKRMKDGEASDLHERFCNAFMIDTPEAKRIFWQNYRVNGPSSGDPAPALEVAPAP